MKPNRSMPESSIIPELPYPDVREAVDWLCDRFHFVERLRIGSHRAQLTFGNGSVIVTKSGDRPLASQSIMVRVPTVMELYEHAREKGVQILNPPTDYPYGERQFTAADPAGHMWIFSETITDVDPAEWGGEYLAGN